MITAKKIIEQYVTLGHMFGDSVPIYSNPTSNDFLSLVKDAKSFNRRVVDVRFIADAKKQSVYIADSFLIGHAQMRQALSYPEGMFSVPWIVQGESTYRNNKLYVHSMNINSDYNKTIISSNLQDFYLRQIDYNWTFVDKYIIGFSNEYENLRHYIKNKL